MPWFGSATGKTSPVIRESRSNRDSLGSVHPSKSTAKGSTMKIETGDRFHKRNGRNIPEHFLTFGEIVTVPASEDNPLPYQARRATFDDGTSSFFAVAYLESHAFGNHWERSL